ncbi:Gfo/Idh/MocA family oxidoreductase [Gammaproteobacteria bacterium]|nr:Gfo/Idh/MocA family oxidoreductase [Gammaproteobacteria bacterium]
MTGVNSFKIVLIGGGQLGSRYLQGLANSSLDLEIFVVDPSQSSHQTCKDRISEVNDSFDFTNYHQRSSINGLPKKINLVIIATQADIRFKVLKNILDQDLNIDFMIMEKVLFQNLDEYDLSLHLINKHQIKCWVNCTRRAMPIYQKIKSEFSNNSIHNFQLAGGEWGLISNSIHFLDLLNFITGDNEIKINLLDKLVTPAQSISKRKGVYESSGVIEGTIGNTRFKLSSSKASSKNHILKIATDIDEVEINEIDQKVLYTNKEVSREENFIFPNLSEIAGQIIESILIEGVCELPDLETSINVHKPFIKKINYYFKNKFNIDSCPLT